MCESQFLEAEELGEVMPSPSASDSTPRNKRLSRLKSTVVAIMRIDGGVRSDSGKEENTVGRRPPRMIASEGEGRRPESWTRKCVEDLRRGARGDGCVEQKKTGSSPSRCCVSTSFFSVLSWPRDARAKSFLI